MCEGVGREHARPPSLLVLIMSARMQRGVRWTRGKDTQQPSNMRAFMSCNWCPPGIRLPPTHPPGALSNQHYQVDLTSPDFDNADAKCLDAVGVCYGGAQGHCVVHLRIMAIFASK